MILVQGCPELYDNGIIEQMIIKLEDINTNIEIFEKFL